MFAIRRFIKSVEKIEISEIKEDVIAKCAPKTKVKTVKFEPIKLPRRRENLFLFKQEIDKENSGNVVPNVKIVAPIRDSEIPSFFAISEESITETLALIITNAKPKHTKTKSLIRLVFHTNPLLVKTILFLIE